MSNLQRRHTADTISPEALAAGRKRVSTLLHELQPEHKRTQTKGGVDGGRGKSMVPESEEKVVAPVFSSHSSKSRRRKKLKRRKPSLELLAVSSLTDQDTLHYKTYIQRHKKRISGISRRSSWGQDGAGTAKIGEELQGLEMKKPVLRKSSFREHELPLGTTSQDEKPLFRGDRSLYEENDITLAFPSDDLFPKRAEPLLRRVTDYQSSEAHLSQQLVKDSRSWHSGDLATSPHSEKIVIDLTTEDITDDSTSKKRGQPKRPPHQTSRRKCVSPDDDEDSSYGVADRRSSISSPVASDEDEEEDEGEGGKADATTKKKKKKKKKKDKDMPEDEGEASAQSRPKMRPRPRQRETMFEGDELFSISLESRVVLFDLHEEGTPGSAPPSPLPTLRQKRLQERQARRQTEKAEVVAKPARYLCKLEFPYYYMRGEYPPQEEDWRNPLMAVKKCYCCPNDGNCVFMLHDTPLHDAKRDPRQATPMRDAKRDPRQATSMRNININAGALYLANVGGRLFVRTVSDLKRTARLRRGYVSHRLPMRSFARTSHNGSSRASLVRGLRCAAARCLRLTTRRQGYSHPSGPQLVAGDAENRGATAYMVESPRSQKRMNCLTRETPPTTLNEHKSNKSASNKLQEHLPGSVRKSFQEKRRGEAWTGYCFSPEKVSPHHTQSPRPLPGGNFVFPSSAKQGDCSQADTVPLWKRAEENATRNCCQEDNLPLLKDSRTQGSGARSLKSQNISRSACDLKLSILKSFSDSNATAPRKTPSAASVSQIDRPVSTFSFLSIASARSMATANDGKLLFPTLSIASEEDDMKHPSAQTASLLRMNESLPKRWEPNTKVQEAIPSITMTSGDSASVKRRVCSVDSSSRKVTKPTKRDLCGPSGESGTTRDATSRHLKTSKSVQSKAAATSTKNFFREVMTNVDCAFRRKESPSASLTETTAGKKEDSVKMAIPRDRAHLKGSGSVEESTCSDAKASRTAVSLRKASGAGGAVGNKNGLTHAWDRARPATKTAENCSKMASSTDRAPSSTGSYLRAEAHSDKKHSQQQPSKKLPARVHTTDDKSKKPPIASCFNARPKSKENGLNVATTASCAKSDKEKPSLEPSSCSNMKLRAKDLSSKKEGLPNNANNVKKVSVKLPRKTDVGTKVKTISSNTPKVSGLKFSSKDLSPGKTGPARTRTTRTQILWKSSTDSGQAASSTDESPKVDRPHAAVDGLRKDDTPTRTSPLGGAPLPRVASSGTENDADRQKPIPRGAPETGYGGEARRVGSNEGLAVGRSSDTNVLTNADPTVISKRDANSRFESFFELVLRLDDLAYGKAHVLHSSRAETTVAHSRCSVDTSGDENSVVGNKDGDPRSDIHAVAAASDCSRCIDMGQDTSAATDSKGSVVDKDQYTRSQADGNVCPVQVACDSAAKDGPTSVEGIARVATQTTRVASSKTASHSKYTTHDRNTSVGNLKDVAKVTGGKILSQVRSRQQPPSNKLLGSTFSSPSQLLGARSRGKSRSTSKKSRRADKNDRNKSSSRTRPKKKRKRAPQDKSKKDGLRVLSRSTETAASGQKVVNGTKSTPDRKIAVQSSSESVVGGPQAVSKTTSTTDRKLTFQSSRKPSLPKPNTQEHRRRATAPHGQRLRPRFHQTPGALAADEVVAAILRGEQSVVLKYTKAPSKPPLNLPSALHDSNPRMATTFGVA